MMEEDLRARLKASATIIAAQAKSVEWIERPQASALPSITLQIISPGRAYTLEGPDSLQGPRVQIDCWGATYRQARVLSRAVMTTIEQPATVGGTKFGPAFLDGARDLPAEDQAGGTTIYRVSQDYTIWHEGA